MCRKLVIDSLFANPGHEPLGHPPVVLLLQPLVEAGVGVEVDVGKVVAVQVHALAITVVVVAGMATLLVFSLVDCNFIVEVVVELVLEGGRCGSGGGRGWEDRLLDPEGLAALIHGMVPRLIVAVVVVVLGGSLRSGHILTQPGDHLGLVGLGQLSGLAAELPGALLADLGEPVFVVDAALVLVVLIVQDGFDHTLDPGRALPSQIAGEEMMLDASGAVVLVVTIGEGGVVMVVPRREQVVAVLDDRRLVDPNHNGMASQGTDLVLGRGAVRALLVGVVVQITTDAQRHLRQGGDEGVVDALVPGDAAAGLAGGWDVEAAAAAGACTGGRCGSFLAKYRAGEGRLNILHLGDIFLSVVINDTPTLR